MPHVIDESVSACTLMENDEKHDTPCVKRLSALISNCDKPSMRSTRSLSSLARGATPLDALYTQILAGLINESTCEFFESRILLNQSHTRELQLVAHNEQGALYDSKMILDIHRIQDAIHVLKADRRNETRENEKLKTMVGILLKEHTRLQNRLERVQPNGYVATQIQNFLHLKSNSAVQSDC